MCHDQFGCRGGMVWHKLPHQIFERFQLIMGMADQYWEDEVMYYAEEHYMDNYLDNMTSTFGIVNMEERDIDRDFHHFQFPRCNCVMLYTGPYSKL